MTTTQKVRKEVREYRRLSFYDRLKLLIQRLNKKDKRRVIKYLVWYEPAKKANTKLSQLFDFLLKNPEASMTIAMEHVEIKKVRTFNMLVERLRDKIGYCLTNEITTQGKDCEYSDKGQAESETIHKLFRASIYIGKKNLPQEALLLYNQVIKLSKRYEHYFPLVQALHLKRAYMKLREGTKEHKEITADIEKYERCLQLYLKAWGYFNEYSRYATYYGYKADFVEKFEDKVKELEQWYDESGSATMGFYYCQIKIALLCEIQRFEEAKIYAGQLLNLVSESDAIHQRERMGMAYGTLAETLNYCGEFEMALGKVSAAQNYLIPNSFNYSISEEIEFRALFYSAQYEKAEKVIRGVLNNPKYKLPPYLLHKRRYYHACVLFVLGDYTKCANILETIKEIKDDVKGWNIGLKVLSILCSIADKDREELTKAKILQYQYEIDKLKELRAARSRDIEILNLINRLFKKNCDFKVVFKERKELLELLENNDPDYRWIPNCHEMIIFHKWFLSMMYRKPYHVDLSQDKMQRLVSV